MPSCAALGCKNRDDFETRRRGITFHSFPHSDPDRFHHWLTNIRRKEWTPSARARLCSQHFEPSCFDRTGQTTRLRAEAIPTKFNFSNLLKKTHSRKQLKIKEGDDGSKVTVQDCISSSVLSTNTEVKSQNIDDSPKMSSVPEVTMKRKTDSLYTNENVDLAPKFIRVTPSELSDSADELGSTAEDENKGSTADKGTNTEEDYICDIEQILKNYNENLKELELEEYKQMLQKFYTQNLRLATRCQKLKAAVEKNQTTTTRILREASKQVNPHQLAFISAQLINKGKPPRKRVWSPQMKNIMVGLYRVSPLGFRFLSKALLLPEEEEVVQWISHGIECDLVEEDMAEKKGAESSNDSITMEAQAVLDEIAFENLMATLL